MVSLHNYVLEIDVQLRILTSFHFSIPSVYMLFAYQLFHLCLAYILKDKIIFELNIDSTKVKKKIQGPGINNAC